MIIPDSLHTPLFIMAPVALTPSSLSVSSPNGQKAAAAWRAVEHTDHKPRTEFAFDTMEDALAGFARGEFLVVMDDENRENEGDLIIAASHCTTEKMAWMIKHTRFVIAALSILCIHPLLAVCFSLVFGTCEFTLVSFFDCSGYICIALPGDRLEQLEIPMMVPENEDRHRTAYTVTVDYKHGQSALARSGLYSSGVRDHNRYFSA